jgi:DNA-directed RNA polymerase subunit RPC12/RpoP
MSDSKLKYQCAECGAPISMIPSRDTTVAAVPLRSCGHLNAAIAALLSATVHGDSQVAA